jgi:protein phosphatase
VIVGTDGNANGCSQTISSIPLVEQPETASPDSVADAECGAALAENNDTGGTEALPEGATGLCGDALPELVESVGTGALPDIAEGASIIVGDGIVIQVSTLLRHTGPVQHYAAVLETTAESVWLRATCDAEASDALQHEARVLAELVSPFFPRCIGVGVQEGVTFLAIEQVPEQTLADLLAGPPRPTWQRLLSILAQTARALEDLHNAGWAHLALRPMAIALGRPVKVLDCSFAQRLGETPPSGWAFSGYSPHETVERQPADVRSDVYALGALLYRACQGEPLDEFGPALETWVPPWWAAGVPQILRRCLGERETRYADVATLRADLLRLARRGQAAVSYRIGAATTIGLEPTRTSNQDAYGTLTGQAQGEAISKRWALVCLADGMGGMEAGDVAAGAAVSTVLHAAAALASGPLPDAQQQAALVKEWSRAAGVAAYRALDACHAHGGCTLLVALLVDRRLTVAHIGDCRLYLVRRGGTELLTRDHSVAMALALQQEITIEDIRLHADRSKLTRSLGEREILAEYMIDGLDVVSGGTSRELQPADMLILVSDGVWEPLLDAEMAALISEQEADLPAAAHAVIRATLQKGGADNATVVVVRLDDCPPVAEETPC